jgi:protein SCO1/2
VSVIVALAAGAAVSACAARSQRPDRLPFYDAPDFTPHWTDSSTHHVGAFSLITQTGASITDADLRGRISVASFMFARCPTICPAVISNLKAVQRAVGASDVWLVSFSVTPEVDSPALLAELGRARGIDPARWRLVTGDRRQIYTLARDSYFADDRRVGGPDEILHSEKVLLVDRHGRLRGVYNGTLPFDIERLLEDIRLLHATAD